MSVTILIDDFQKYRKRYKTKFRRRNAINPVLRRLNYRPDLDIPLDFYPVSRLEVVSIFPR